MKLVRAASIFPKGRFAWSTMRRCALAISIISVLYNAVEGGVSVGFGGDAGSKSLLVFGIQSFIEVASAVLVIYRFHKGENETSLIMERQSTLAIGVLFIALTLGTWGAAIAGLVLHQSPDSSIPSLLISASALAFMILIWLPKPWIAEELNSSVMRSEAKCSLACIYLTTVLFFGSLIYRFWQGGWWIDSVLAILLSFFFFHEGYEMISWAHNRRFDGGCCQTCHTPPVSEMIDVKCKCCEEKMACIDSGPCVCLSDADPDSVDCCGGPTTCCN